VRLFVATPRSGGFLATPIDKGGSRRWRFNKKIDKQGWACDWHNNARAGYATTARAQGRTPASRKPVRRPSSRQKRPKWLIIAVTAARMKTGALFTVSQ
jgi:hypothetical protein